MKGLILLDWDNTVIDDQSHINDTRLQEVIKWKISEGWEVGLNSDTPFRRLHGWWKSMNMNGPIIAEKGAVIWRPGEKPFVLLKTAEVFSTFRERVISTVTKLEDYSLFYGDSTHFINSVTQITSNDSIILVLDSYRVCSLAMFVRRIVDGKLFHDIPTTEIISNLLISMYPPGLEVSEIDLNREHCFICINDPNAKKSIGVKELLERWGKPSQVYMIGDSMSDYLDLPQVEQLAVGNAQTEYIKVSSRVARSNHAKGCVELISEL